VNPIQDYPVRICACSVRFRDRRGVEHSTEVRAGSVYEAVCGGWAIFKRSGETEEESYKTEKFIVELREQKTYEVDLERMLAWLGRGRPNRNDTPRKQQLRKLLDAGI